MPDGIAGKLLDCQMAAPEEFAVMLRRVGLVAMLTPLVAAACSAPSSSAARPASTPSTTATASALPSAEEISGTFDIGEGRELFLDCEGSGSPTILLEAGDQDTGFDAYRFVMPELIGETHTCTYARAGLGTSSPASGCRQLPDLLDDLDALLASAGVDGPYVLVGASGGGFIMAGFAARHPRQVAGMVFVETPKALTARLYPEVLPDIKCDAPGNIERRDYLAVEHAAWDHRKQLGDFPLTVLSNNYGDSVEPNTDEATNVKDQRGWFALTSAKGRQVVVTTGHNVARDQPDLVIREIVAVLSAARGG